VSIDSDLAFMLGDWGSVPVEIAGWCGRGVVDEVDNLTTDRNGDALVVRQTVLRLRRSDFQDTAGALTVARNDQVVVDGITYYVGDSRVGSADVAQGQELDGRELHLVLRRA
jgi:hypothetical protein